MLKFQLRYLVSTGARSKGVKVKIFHRLNSYPDQTDQHNVKIKPNNFIQTVQVSKGDNLRFPISLRQNNLH